MTFQDNFCFQIKEFNWFCFTKDLSNKNYFFGFIYSNQFGMDFFLYKFNLYCEIEQLLYYD